MPNLTYTAQGHFTNQRKMIVDVCIPNEPSAGIYTTHLYNLSKKTNNGSINAVFCFFDDGKEIAIEHDKFDYRLSIDLDTIKDYAHAINFDFNANETLFIFFHNRTCDEKDLDKYFTELEERYDRVKKFGNQSEDGIIESVKKMNMHPRRVGMSLIHKQL